MKIAFDVDVLAKQMDINRMVHQVADWGYKYIEQSPPPRINLFINIRYFQKNAKQNTGRHSGKPEWKSPLLLWYIVGLADSKSRDNLQ